ncbi:MAG: hypothetical protein ACREFO_21225 [Acetobacteraceae bacterium]
MTEEPAAGAAAFAASEIEALARDWIAIWQSELGSYAGDREVTEAWLRLLGLWAGAATSVLSACPRAPIADPPPGTPPSTAPPSAEPSPTALHEWTDRRPGADEKARTSAAALASDAGLAALERLDQRLAGLEQRLAALERAVLAEGGEAGRRPRPARRTRRDGISSRGPG